MWFGHAVKVHWALPDPSALTGSEAAVREAFFSVMETITQRVEQLLALDLAGRPHAERQRLLNDLVQG